MQAAADDAPSAGAAPGADESTADSLGQEAAPLERFSDIVPGRAEPIRQMAATASTSRSRLAGCVQFQDIVRQQSGHVERGMLEVAGAASAISCARRTPRTAAGCSRSPDALYDTQVMAAPRATDMPTQPRGANAAPSGEPAIGLF
ncbi:hypothetical protein [Mangrovibrevibacter kandeliae]|uniref:hypothetical protein n=1 Tax=Mangrovibrevibacter kandeliae TaxID=2968473 RepID=UPI002118733B|nr:hypothetical protein [Aurantimonas sp. CSK15Z-1]MCQ8782873.1 hypothetical protein [Aurantimonas sp. CSK15Z-1]